MDSVTAPQPVPTPPVGFSRPTGSTIPGPTKKAGWNGWLHVFLVGVLGLMLYGGSGKFVLPKTSVNTVSQVPVATASATPTSVVNGLTVADENGQTDVLLAPRIKTGNCQYLGDPSKGGVNADEACTPGAVFQGVTVQQVCSRSTSTVRDVPLSVKDQVYAEYGIASHTRGQYEVDHRIALEDGGANNIANLWPQPATPSPGFREKDVLETQVHDDICSGRITLQEAWARLLNWVDAYNSSN